MSTLEASGLRRLRVGAPLVLPELWSEAYSVGSAAAPSHLLTSRPQGGLEFGEVSRN